jgi:small subunit ribosomal protein S2
MDTTLRGEPTIEPDTASESDDEAEPIPQDDLIRIEGIGPKISTVVFAAGITTFAELSSTDVERLEAILDEAGIHTANPSTWPEQARLAAQGQWDDLKELQDRIKNGQLEV